MRTWHMALLALAVGLSGCRKKHAPEYFEIDARVQVLSARDGDDAWVSPEMGTLAQRLTAIPEGRIESADAQKLAARIASEAARVTAAKKALAAPVAAAAPAVMPGLPPSDAMAPVAPPSEPEAPAAADAGTAEERPTAGMDQAEFVRKFGSCFEGERDVQEPGSGAMLKGFRVAARAECTKKYGSTDQSFVFLDKKLRGILTETQTVIVRDAGVVRPTAPGPQAPAPALPAPAPRNTYESTPAPAGANPYDSTPRPGTP